MRLTITIDLDNAAFEEGGAEEVARILASVAERIPDPLDQTGGDLSLHDANGNWCGAAWIDEGGDSDELTVLRDVMRVLVTPTGVPAKGKGRTAEQQRVLDAAYDLI